MNAPSRQWDFHSPKYGGVYFWFDEMVYMNGYSLIKEIRLDQATGKILRDFGNNTTTMVACGECHECNTKKLCRFNYFEDAIQKAYADWYQRVFESTFENRFIVGEGNDP